MSHHGHDPERAAAMSGLMKQLMGEYPNGRLNKDDAGAVAMAVSSESSVVRLDFPKPVTWIGFTGDQAIQLAQDLMKHARRAGITTPVVLRIGE
jgi:hypothetical protein